MIAMSDGKKTACVPGAEKRWIGKGITARHVPKRCGNTPTTHANGAESIISALNAEPVEFRKAKVSVRFVGQKRHGIALRIHLQRVNMPRSSQLIDIGQRYDTETEKPRESVWLAEKDLRSKEESDVMPVLKRTQEYVETTRKRRRNGEIKVFATNAVNLHTRHSNSVRVAMTNPSRHWKRQGQ